MKEVLKIKMDDDKKRDDIIRLILSQTRDLRTGSILEHELNRFQLTKKEDYQQQSLKIDERPDIEPLTSAIRNQRLLTLTEVKER